MVKHLGIKELATGAVTAYILSTLKIDNVMYGKVNQKQSQWKNILIAPNRLQLLCKIYLKIAY